MEGSVMYWKRVERGGWDFPRKEREGTAHTNLVWVVTSPAYFVAGANYPW
jgi:hypothetical protein